jgi:hypothetical protein
MKNINTNKYFKSEFARNTTILIASLILIYLLASLYFANHFFFNTVINGVDVSLIAHDTVDDIMRGYIKGYKLQLIERNGEIDELAGQDIGLQYNERNGIYKIYSKQKSLKWFSSLIAKQNYYVEGLYVYDKGSLENRINELNCLNKEMIEPQNVGFQYSNGSYEMIPEIYGNRIYRDKLNDMIEKMIQRGKTELDLNENHCYANPKYTLSSDKARRTNDILNKCISTKITYNIRSESEILDNSIIKQWLSVDENLDIRIDEKSVEKYVQGLGKKHDTVGIARRIKTSRNTMVEVKGGYYGWKIDRAAETKALIEHIKRGDVLEKEPIYSQKALTRDKNDIGNTYVEINITKQHLWFYKNGKLFTQGAVVTGNPNKGYSTKVGVYMLNYKDKESILRGHNYEAEVTYWMPFNGNIGIHDASWRYSFGGNIYKRNGSHGCVNVPPYLAKKIFENIEDGTPIICYEEEN